VWTPGQGAWPPGRPLRWEAASGGKECWKGAGRVLGGAGSELGMPAWVDSIFCLWLERRATKGTRGWRGEVQLGAT